MEEVPGEHAHEHPTVHSPPLTPTSSPAASSSPRELTSILDRALALKQAPAASQALAGRSVALLFEQPSTRTRTSCEAGVFELGGHPMVLRANELQLTRGESVRDTALVFSRHVARDRPADVERRAARGARRARDGARS